MWMLFYYALRLVRNNSRSAQIFKGILLIVIVDGLAKFFGLKTLQFLTDMFINWGFLAIIIIFTPEIRSLLEQMGKSNFLSRITALSGNEKENLVDQIVTAVMLLSKDQTGALISIEQSHSLDDFVSTGTKLNSDVTAELLTSIFVTSTPLHDGAVIIQGDKIACAAAYFPPTNLALPSRYGARHRAAIGISEITDAVTIIVSEETGAISVTENGKIFQMSERQLREYLMRVILGEATEVRSRPRTYRDENTGGKKESSSGVLSFLAVKKQEEEKNEDVMETLEDNADAIKLPHHKKGPAVPSYPEQEERVVPEMPDEAEENTDVVHDASELGLSLDEEPEETQPRRMTAEEVAAERQAAYARFSSRKSEETEEVKQEVRRPAAADEQIFDTSAIDVTKIAGFDNELDKTFRMVDRMDTGKGGDSDD